MGKDEDVVPTEYKYAWWPGSDTALEDFLQNYRPSMVQNDGTKPWIWVSSGKDHANTDGQTAAIEEAAELLQETTEKVEAIKNDPSIPVRSNKKTGARSKKEVREEVQAEATKKLQEIAQKHGYVTGKWLIFAPADKVDMIWSGIAKSLVSGALASTAALQAKVSTSPEHDQQNYQHVICVYVPDVYDKAAVAEVPIISLWTLIIHQIMRILLRNHGASLSGVKSDLYTYIGIDSKHPSGIQSTIWKNSAVLGDVETKELKDAFFKELSEKKPDTESTDPAAEKPAPAPATAPKKPLLKRKKKANDPFASDDEDADEPKAEAQSTEPPSTHSAKPPSKSSVKPPSRSSAKPRSKTGSKAPSGTSTKPSSRATQKRKAEPIQEDSEEDSDGDTKPKKRAPAKKPAKKRAKVDEEDND
ncbi:hypothetical protein HDZ31DRAFT_37237 [Schizophyllum fasciatum]